MISLKKILRFVMKIKTKKLLSSNLKKEIMKKFVLFILVALSVSCISCVDNSEWGKVVIPADQKIVFFDAKSVYEDKQIIVLVGSDTMAIDNFNLIQKICYFKMAFPDSAIYVKYIRTKEDGKNILVPRFISLKKQI